MNETTRCNQCSKPGVYWCAACVTHHGPSQQYPAHEEGAA